MFGKVPSSTETAEQNETSHRFNPTIFIPLQKTDFNRKFLSNLSFAAFPYFQRSSKVEYDKQNLK